MRKIIYVLPLLALLLGGCSGHKGGGAKLKTDVDSVAYIIGMNVGENLMKMDSTMNVDAVCEGIRDYFRSKTLMTMADAKTYYLRYQNYILPAQALGMEEQYLADLAKKDRDYARTKSGVTYAVKELGDQSLLPSLDRDSVAVRLTIKTTDGIEVYSSYAQKDTLRTTLGGLCAGLKESLRLIGKGGTINAWIPSARAYGADGNAEWGIAPNTTYDFEVELLGVGKQNTNNGRIKY